VLPRAEIAEVLLHIAHRGRLMELPGLTRHRSPTQQEREENRKCKIPLEEHLKQLVLMDEKGRPIRPAIAIGNRNLGNNHGFVAWQCEDKPRLFHVQGDPLSYPSYSCLVAANDGGLAIEHLRFDATSNSVFRANNDEDLTDRIAWATFGQCVLRAGKPVSIADIIDQFYDVRHVLAFDTSRPEGRRIADDIFANYPQEFRHRALQAWTELGVPRNRYLHNCVGLSPDNVIILQREGTPEEVGHWLCEAGAEDGIVLDNGGSVGCWAWWVYPNGGFIFTAPDYRPPASSIIAFVLRGPVRTSLPGESVSFTVV